MSKTFGVEIKREAAGTAIVSIAPMRADREGFLKPVKMLRTKSPESAQRWVEHHFGPVTWIKIDRFYPASTAAACSILATDAAVQAAR